MKELQKKALVHRKKYNDSKAELEKTNKAIAEAGQEDVTELKTKATELMGAMKAAVAELETTLAEIEEQKKADAALAGLAELEKTDTTDKSLGFSSAQSTDKDMEIAAHRKAFQTYIQKGTNGLSDQERDRYMISNDAAVNRQYGHNVQFTKGQGGFVAPRTLSGLVTKALPMISADADRSALTTTDFRSELLMSPLPQPSIYDLITIVPTKAGSVTWPKLVQTDANEFGGVSLAWTAGEGVEKTATEAKFTQVNIPIRELNAYTEISHVLLSRSVIDLENLLGRIFREAVRYELERVTLVGNGTTEPLGILNTPGVNEVSRQTAGTVIWQDTVRLMGAIHSYMSANARYAMSRTALTELMLGQDGQARPIMQTNVGQAQYPTLNGKPYNVSEQLPVVGTTGDVLYGNFAEYIGAMEQDVVFRRSDDYKFRDNVAAFAVFVLFGGKLVEPRAFAKLDADVIATP